MFTDRERARATVVAWDVAHNALGRAHVLQQLLEADYDTEILGPMWPDFGTEPWEPLRNADLPLRTAPVADQASFWGWARAVASERRTDLVVISKPRLPSMQLGLLLSDTWDAPVVLDIDDNELAFISASDLRRFSEMSDAQLTSAIEAEYPWDGAGTVLADRVARMFEACTVSNPALQMEYGGTVVRHARDLDRYAITPDQRQAARSEQGIAADEFALFFLGTPRPHKGLDVLLDAVARIDHPISVHVVGEADPGPFAAWLTRQHEIGALVLSGNRPFDDLPGVLCAADAVVLPQSAESDRARYQVPAKVSDAVAMGLPVLCTPTDAMADLAALGLVSFIEPHEISDEIKRLIGEDPASRSFPAALAAEVGLERNREQLYDSIAKAKLSQPATRMLSRFLLDESMVAEAVGGVGGEELFVALRNERDALATELERLGSQLIEAQESLEEERKVSQQTLAEARKLRADSKSATVVAAPDLELVELRKEVVKLRDATSQLPVLRMSRTALFTELSGRSVEIAALRAEVEELRAVLARSAEGQSSKREESKRLAASEKALAAAVVELEQSRRALSGVEQELDVTKAAEVALMESAVALNEQVAGLQAELIDAQQSKPGIEPTQDIPDPAFQKMLAKLSAAEAELAAKTAQLEATLAHTATMHTAFRATHDQAAVMADELAVLRGQRGFVARVSARLARRVTYRRSTGLPQDSDDGE